MDPSKVSLAQGRRSRGVTDGCPAQLGKQDSLTWTRRKARPLEALDFRFRPLTPLALAWSCDAELAVALDDAIHVLIPEYPKEKSGGDKDGAFDEALHQPQFSLALQVSGIFLPEPSINARLCAAGGVRLPQRGAGDDFRFRGAGRGPLSRSGAALGQTVRVEWSPGGLGQNLRPVLAALTTNGAVVALGEAIDAASTVASGATARSFKNWRVLWGLGARLPVPDASRDKGFREMDDKIVAFSWARELLPGRALLAYTNDAGAIVIMGVQHLLGPRDEAASAEQEPVWQLSELARFDGRGPHRVRSEPAPAVRAPRLTRRRSQTPRMPTLCPLAAPLASGGARGSSRQAPARRRWPTLPTTTSASAASPWPATGRRRATRSCAWSRRTRRRFASTSARGPLSSGRTRYESRAVGAEEREN